MQRLCIHFLFLILSCSLTIHAKAIRKGQFNETLLVGQINGPSGDAARNLMGMILSMNVFLNNTILHSSLISITNSTFPLNYSIVLNDHDFQLENITQFSVTCMIFQPVYVFDNEINLPENETNTLSLDMHTIKFVIIRGEIVHDKHSKGQDLPATQIKLELIEDQGKDEIIDQVDFICTSTKYPCPFEYCLDTVHIKANVEYKLEAIIADRILPARKSKHDKHPMKSAETKSSNPTKFKINPTIDSEINGFKIVVVDAE